MLKIYNTLTNKIEEFKPIEENKVKMYVCGPTVYDHAHLGHARCYITWDTLYRYLKFKGYDVTYCRNVTDVDDKILKKSDTEKVEPSVITDRYYKSFINSMNGLNVLKPDVEPRATKTLGEMIAMVKKLETDGFAYAVDGDVYFRVEKYAKQYGFRGKGTLPIFIKNIFDKTLKEFGVNRKTKSGYLKCIGYDFDRIRSLIDSNIPMVLSINKDGRNYYNNHSITVIGYLIYQVDNALEPMLLVYDNWNTQACVVDYKALSMISSINYMG